MSFYLNLSLLCIFNYFLPRSTFFMLSRFRANFVLPAFSAQFNMAKAFTSSETIYITPFLGTQQIYVSIKQVVALCSQTSLKCSVAGPPERVRVSLAGEPGSHTVFVSTSELGSLLLKELCLCLFLTNRVYLRKKCG